MAKSPSGSAEFTVTTDVVEAYAATLGIDPAGEVPSGLASVVTYAAVAAMPVKAGVVLVRQAFAFHRPARVGDVLRTDFEAGEPFAKRGRTFMVISTRTVDQYGELIVTGEITRLLPERIAGLS